MPVEFVRGNGPWESLESGTPVFRQAYAGHGSQVALARAYIRRMLGPRCGFDAELVGTELVSNAILYTDSGKHGGRFVVYVLLGRTAAVAVEDQGGAGTPLVGVQEEGSVREGGRGLELVTELALRCGYWGDPVKGHTVWAELPMLKVMGEALR